ncbi:MAG: phosphoglucosamine mutase, partial [Acidimicrobiales bacterium]
QCSLAELAASSMTRLPQVLHNVSVAEPGLLAGAPAVWEAVGAAEAELGADGRILLRASGTESCVRVMVEANTGEHAEAVARRLGDVVRAELG